MQVPNVKWEDVGGLEDVKKSILDTVQVDFLYGITLLVVIPSPLFGSATSPFYVELCLLYQKQCLSHHLENLFGVKRNLWFMFTWSTFHKLH